MNEGEDQDEALSDILEDVSNRDKAKIYRVLEDINPILDHRTNMINSRRKPTMKLRAGRHRQDQLAAQKAQERQAITRNVVGRVKKKSRSCLDLRVSTLIPLRKKRLILTQRLFTQWMPHITR